MAETLTETQPVRLLLELEGGQDIDSTDLDEMTRTLQSELEDLPYVQDVGPPSGRETSDAKPPEGTKAAEVQTLAGLAVIILPTAIPAAIAFLRDWALRPGNRSVKVKVERGEQSIELEYDPRRMSVDEINELVSAMQAMLAK